MLGWGSLSCLEANLRPLNFICWDNVETFFLWLNDTLTPYILVYCNCTLTILPLRSGAELPRSWILQFWGLFRVYDAARLKYRVVWNLSKTTSDLRYWVTPRSVLLGCRNLASVLEQIFFHFSIPKYRADFLSRCHYTTLWALWNTVYDAWSHLKHLWS